MAGIAAYTRIGFEVDERGVARTDGDHLQFVLGSEGLQSIALASDDLAADSAAVRARGSVDWVRLAKPELQQTKCLPDWVRLGKPELQQTKRLPDGSG